MGNSFFYTEKLDIGYNKKALVKDIAFDIDKGEIVSLIGANGSGKSTLLKTLAKLITLVDGNVYADNKNIVESDYKEISKIISVVLTDKIKPELMSVYDVVSQGRYPYTSVMGRMSDSDRNVVDETIKLCQIEDIADKDYSKLSDGQKQRVMLARALVQEPKVLILDEPTAYLDIKYKVMLFEILKNLSKEKGLIVLMSLHEIDLALKVSDKVLCLKNNRVFAYGNANEISDKEIIKELYDIDDESYRFIFE